MERKYKSGNISEFYVELFVPGSTLDQFEACTTSSGINMLCRKQKIHNSDYFYY